MIDENQNQPIEKQTAEEVSVQPETAGIAEVRGSSGPQPSQQQGQQTTQNDQAAAAQIAGNLQATPQQTSQPVQPSPQPVKKGKKATEPYIKAAEKLIVLDKGDPYKEEVDHEDVQIKYLHDRFGKDIKKENDQ